MRRTSARHAAVSSPLKKMFLSPVFWISFGGLSVMTALFLMWFYQHPGYSLPARLTALTSALLFTGVCLRLVPQWMRFWRFAPGRPAFRSAKDDPASEEPRFMGPKIFLMLLLINACVLIAVFLIRRFSGCRETFLAYLDFWKCTDSGSYLNIARDWYPTEGDTVVQLVFLPGFPVAIRLINWLIQNELISGLLVSALCFPAAGCVLYRLLRLDYSHADALRTLKYVCLLPGMFFYTAPMSESLFLLLCVSCLYCARTGKWTLGCLFGGLAAFTRSLGVTLLVPLIMELVRAIRLHPADKPSAKARWIVRSLSLLLVAAGLGAYLYINYQISGDPFKFQQYQSNHWNQNLGLFFNTAAYQINYAVSTYQSSMKNFLGLWLPNIISCFASLIFMLFAVRRMRASYVAWFIAYFFVAIGATWLLSAPRYLMVMIACPIAISSLTRNPEVDLAATPLCIALNLLYLYAFVMRWQVW